MQYLIKLSLENTPAWRLVALDGGADLAFAAELMAKAFPYPEGARFFEKGGQTFAAGVSGQSAELAALKPFDSLELKAGDIFYFTAQTPAPLRHKAEVMKCEERLWCLIPSCLVGAGQIPKGALSPEAVAAAYEAEETPTLDIKEITNRMRAYGSKRPDSDQALGAGAGIIFVQK